jgi:nucleoside-diphosphate-sugar epimerase
MPPKKIVIKKSALSPTVLIAGGSGFIGSHLAETLLLKDTRVIVLDNFRTGDRQKVEHLLSNPRFALYDVDINQGLPEEIESVDYIFHLAGLEEHGTNVTLDSLLTNAIGTKNLLDLAQRSGARFVLASSSYVYHGMMSQLNLDQYFGRTGSEEGKYSMTEAKRYAEALVWEYFKKNQTDVRIARFPEVYGPQMNMESSGGLGRMLGDVKSGHDLTVYGAGTAKEYYLYINDAVSGLIKTLFNDRTSGKIYSLVSGESYSDLEIAYLLKSVANSELKIDFRSQDREIEPKRVLPDTANLRELSWEPKVSFKDGILKTLNWMGYEPNLHSFKPAKLIEEKKKEKIEMVDTISSLAPVEFQTQSPAPSQPQAQSMSFAAVKPKIELPKINFPKVTLPHTKIGMPVGAAIGLLVFFATLFIGMPVFQIYINLNKAYGEMKEVPVLLTKFDSGGAQQASNDAFQHLYKTQKALGRLKWLATLTGKRSLYNASSRTLASAAYASRSAYYFSKASVPVSSLWETVRPNSEKTFDAESFEKAKSDFERAQNNLQLSQAELKQVDMNAFCTKCKNTVENYRKILDSSSSQMDLISSAFSGLSDLIGVESSRRYLILFQNSNEIRPTGGFIGSYAILELNSGKITDLTIDDIYNPDGQIDLRNIKVPSPAPIAAYLNEPDLHLRNANWNPDFTKSALDIQDLYYKVTGEEVDGVIAVDLVFAQKLLEVTGPIFLTAYNEEISAQNLAERAQYHSEFTYTNGSDQKRSFLTVLGSKLLEKIFAVPQENMPAFWAAVNSSLEERHLMIYLNDNPFAAYLEKEGWDGRLVKTDNDYLSVVNANLGGTKANYFVKNEMKYEVFSATRDGLLRGTVTLKYTHTGESDSWPGGPYKDYVRVLTQNGSKITSAKIKYVNKEEQDIFKDVIISKAGNYNSFEYGFTLNPKESVELSISYDLPTTLTLSKDKLGYNLYWQKQPGTDNDKFNFVFTPPFGLKAVPSAFEGTLNQDQEISVSLEPL